MHSKDLENVTFLQGPAFDEVCIEGAVCKNSKCIKLSDQQPLETRLQGVKN
jgi:hypothetical protein